MSSNDKRKQARAVKRATNFSMVIGSLYDYIDNLSERRNEMDVNGASGSEKLAIEDRISRSNKVASVVESFKGWDFNTLLERMKGEKYSINEEDQNRFDPGAINIADSKLKKDMFKSSYIAQKKIVNAVWEEASSSDDPELKKHLIQAAKDIKANKGNNLHVVFENYSKKETHLISQEMGDSPVDSNEIEATGKIKRIIKENLPEKSRYMEIEDKDWDKIRFRSRPQGRNLADYKSEEQKETKRYIVEDAIPSRIESESLTRSPVESKDNFYRGIESIQKALGVPTKNDMQSVLDNLEAKAYRTNDRDLQQGMLEAIEIASDHIVDVSINKTRKIILGVSENLLSHAETINQEEVAAVNDMLTGFKGNDLKSLLNKFGAISVGYQSIDKEDEHTKHLKKAAGISYISLQDKIRDINSSFDELAQTSP